MQNLSRMPKAPLWGLLLLLVAAASPPAMAQVVINEVLGDPNQDWDGDGVLTYRNDEWVEICNRGSLPADLSEYWLRDDFGSDPHIQLSGTLAPGEIKVIYGSEVVAWQQANDQPVIGLSINNTGDSMELLHSIPDVTGTSLVMVHRVTLLDHEVEDDRSSGLGQEEESWLLFDGLNPYAGSTEPVGSECLPTPGEPNICATNVPTQRPSWGSLKSIYRHP